ncbi:MAG: hypothetical protein AAF483_15055 [Planctomycetota bacterium]
MSSQLANETYDHVIAVHSIYYMENLTESLVDLMRLCSPEGAVVIAVAPFEEMNQLANIFWSHHQNHNIWFEHDVIASLVKLNVNFKRIRIDATLNDPESDETLQNDILSFLLQSLFDRLPIECRELTIAFLKQIGESKNTYLTVPHPVSLIVVKV